MLDLFFAISGHGPFEQTSRNAMRHTQRNLDSDAVMFFARRVRVLWFFFSSRRRHTRLTCDWSSDVCSSDLLPRVFSARVRERGPAPPEAETFIMSWCGMRGIVSLAAALALPEDLMNGAPFPKRDLKIGRASCRERGYSSACARVC